MTRLRTEWIEYMLDGMEEYNKQLKIKTGMDLADFIKDTFNMQEADFKKAKDTKRIAVVPITQGEGIISSFSESVAAIVKSIGFNALVTEHTDINGIYEGTQKGCDIFFFADDARYLALNIKSGNVCDNNYATALGFIKVLKALMDKNGKNIREEKVLQLGYGIVGREAEKILLQDKINFDIFDKNFDVIKELPYEKLTEKDQIRNYNYIVDFTNEGGWLKKECLSPDLLYVSPGVPYSMDSEAEAYFENRAVHDNLEIGTAIMLGRVIAD